MTLGKTLADWMRPSPPSSAIDDGRRLHSASRSHVGRVRTINEDRILDDPEHGLWAIADGMGGHSAGDIAAEATIAALRDVANAGRIGADAIEGALQAVNLELCRGRRHGGQTSGATVVTMIALGERMTILWAGDCRAYRYRDGCLTQLTRDHSVVQELVDAGALDAAQAVRHPKAHVVTRALGAADVLTVDRVTIDIARDDLLLLCSDGLSIAPDALRETLGRRAQRLQDVVDLLLDQALDAGGRDNISIVLVGGRP